MPPARTAPKTRATAAQVETNGGVKTKDFRGLKLELPATCPGEVLFDIGENNISSSLRTLVGERQYREVREKVVSEGLSLEETATELGDLLEDIFADVYGISSGE